MLLALDPSIVSCGVALFRDGRLCAATTIKQNRGAAQFNQLTRCALMSGNVRAWVAVQEFRHKELVDIMSAEWPVIYAPGKGKPAPSTSIPGLSGVATGVAALLHRAKPLMALECYTPREWTLGTKKEGPDGKLKTWRQSTRYHRINKRMHDVNAHGNPPERIVWEVDVTTHDAMDAVGIGLYHLGRFDPIRVISG